MDLRRCICASGLRALRCCELDHSDLPTAEGLAALDPLVRQAQEKLSGGDCDGAEALALQILELAANEPRTLRLLAEIRKRSNPRAAEVLFRRLLAFLPNDLAANHELALLLLNRSALDEAEVHARNTIRLAPENPHSHHLMGMLLTAMNRPHFGEFHYRRAIELLNHRDPALLRHLAFNLKNQGRMVESRQLYAEVDQVEPDRPGTLFAWAQLEEADRHYDAAAGLLGRAERLSANNPSLLLLRAVLHGRARSFQSALGCLDEIARQRGYQLLGPHELLEKGRLLDQIGHYDEAFAAFREGKRSLRDRSGLSYQADEAIQKTRRLKAFFTRSRLGILPRAGVLPDDPRPQPIFIVGFPRSGTTLVEQMLSAHPRIAAGDELPFVNDIAELMPRVLNSPLNYPEALAELWMGDHREALDTLRDVYLQRAEQSGVFRPAARWFTDKMPLNEMHLGLITLLFPRSPVIHLIRHPLDVALSAFSNHLTHGFGCAFELQSIAQHYALIRDLVDHYLAQVPLNYLAIRYEGIVDDQEWSLRRMLDVIGEPFHPGCLTFEENRRYARTASYAQVAEKLYVRSRYRYRNYLGHLEPILPVLQPSIERLGYSVDR